MNTETEDREMKKGIIKSLTVLMAVVLVIGLAACSSDTAAPGANAKAPTQISEFDSTDLAGGQVTNEVLGDADLTMLNFWGTFCPPCIKEMPDLAKLEGEYDGRLQLIGVVMDVDFTKPDSNEYKSALEILSNAGAAFKNISPSGDIANYANSIQYVPTTIFVDPEGSIVGEPVIGANVDEYKKVIEGYLTGE